MTKIAIVSDSHLPSETLPDWVCEHISQADHTIHAGDFASKRSVQKFNTLSDHSLTAVRGNWDPPFEELPVVTTLKVDSITFVISHGICKSINDYQKRNAVLAQQTKPEADNLVAIAGHTHQVLDTVIDGVRILNPGNITGVYPARDPSMMLISAREANF